MANKRMKRCSTSLVGHCCCCCYLVTQSCPILLGPHGLYPTSLLCPWNSPGKILEWVAISFSKGSSQLRDQPHVSCIGRRILYHWSTRGAQSGIQFSSVPQSCQTELNCTPLLIWNQSVVPCPVLTVASWLAYGFLRRQDRWSGIPISLSGIRKMQIKTTKRYYFIPIKMAIVFVNVK